MASSFNLKLIAEFIGAFLLTFAVFISGGNFIVIGITLALIVFLIGGISGAAVNPAVSVGLWYAGTLTTKQFFMYSLVELIGGLFAAFSYKMIS